jgi:hypothetical protein
MSPSVPHLAHKPSLPLLVQAVPAWQAAAAVPAGQQIWPKPPHGVHVPSLQSKPS